jgi:hypothetical protein
MENDGIDTTGANVLTEMFDDVVGEAPKEEIPAEEAPKEEIPAEEAPKEEIPAEVPEGYVPIATHAELRAKSRDKNNDLRQQLNASQIALAKAEGKSEALEQMAAKPAKDLTPPEKSPLEVFEEEYPGEAVTATVMLDQRRWDDAQTEQQAVQTRTQTQGQQVEDGIALARDTYSAEKMGSEELTLDAVVGLARSQGLLTEKDVANLAPFGKRAGTVLYNLATSAIKQAGGVPLQELNRRVINARQTLASKNEKPTNPKPPVKPVVPAAPEGGQPKVDDDDDVSEITNFMFP